MPKNFDEDKLNTYVKAYGRMFEWNQELVKSNNEYLLDRMEAMAQLRQVVLKFDVLQRQVNEMSKQLEETIMSFYHKGKS